ncbi:MAG: QueT transporter family protein [Candidatus Nezhaarchaeales archaeon]
MARSWSRVAAFAGVYAAMYAAATVLLSPISFLFLNIRVADMLRGLLFFQPTGVLVGNFIGHMVANVGSPLGPLDLVSAPMSTVGLALALRLGKRSPYAGFVAHWAVLTLWLTWLLGTAFNISYEAMFMILAPQLFISDYVLPLLLYVSLKKSGFGTVIARLRT